MLELKNVKKRFRDGTIGLDNVNVNFKDRGLVFITGPSGSGKSTLLNLIAGTYKKTKGEILYNGQDISKIKKYQLNEIGYIFQDYNLISNLNIRDNISIINSNKKLPDLGIGELQTKNIHEISGGEARRVAIMRALNKGAKILLCDEPTESLDEENKAKIFEFLKRLSESILVIVVTHDLKYLSIADVIIEMQDGKIKNHRVIHELLENNYVETKNKVNLNKILKLAFNELWQNLGLFSLNLAFLIFTFILMALTISLKNTDIYEIEINSIQDKDKRIVVEKGEEDYLNDWFDKLDARLKKHLNPYYNLFVEGVLASFDFDLRNNLTDISSFYTTDMRAPRVVFIDANTFTDNNEIVGTLPTKADDVIISEYTFEGMHKFGVRLENGEFFHPEGIQDMIGKTIIYGNNLVDVTGVLVQNTDKYSNLKNVSAINENNLALANQYSQFINAIVKNNCIYVLNDFEKFIKPEDKEIIAYYYASNDARKMLDARIKMASPLVNVTTINTGIVFKVDVLLKRLKVFGSIAFIIVLVINIIILLNYFNSLFNICANDNKILKYLGLNSMQISLPNIIISSILVVSSLIIAIFTTKLVFSEVNSFYHSILGNTINPFVMSNRSIREMVFIALIVLFVVWVYNVLGILKSLKKYIR